MSLEITPYLGDKISVSDIDSVSSLSDDGGTYKHFEKEEVYNEL